LKINPANEKFVDNNKANHLLRRVPRPDYAIKVA